MQVFNTHRLTQKQRFNAAIIVGTIAAIGIGILTGYLRLVIAHSSGFDFSIVSIGATYLLAFILRKVGRGVQVKFSVLGGILGFITVSISNVIAFGFPIHYVFNLNAHFMILMSLLNGSLSNVLMLAYQGYAIYIAYSQSRFI